MHNTVKNLLDIENKIKNTLNSLNIEDNPKVIAVSKTFEIDQISLSAVFRLRLSYCF